MPSRNSPAAFLCDIRGRKAGSPPVFISDEDFELLPELYQESITSATDLFAFLKTKSQSFSPCFQPLMKAVDRAATNLLNSLLKESIPVEKDVRDRFFDVDERYYTQAEGDWLRKQAASLKNCWSFPTLSCLLGY